MVFATRGDEHVNHFLVQAGFNAPEAIQPIRRPEPLDFKALDPASIDEARALLLETRNRLSSATTLSVKQRLDRVARLPHAGTWRKDRADQNHTAFSKHESAEAFDQLLSRRPLAAPAVAHALLSLASISSIDELWCYLHNPFHGVTRRVLLIKGSITDQVLKDQNTPPLSWLDTAVSQDDSDFTHLLCQTGVGQEELDRALKTALTLKSVHCSEVLLGYGATVSQSGPELEEMLGKQHDVALARLLLSAPHAVPLETWRNGIELYNDGKTNILLECAAHNPSIINDALLFKYIEAQNVAATAIIFAYICHRPSWKEPHHACTSMVLSIVCTATKITFMRLLQKMQWLDYKILQNELVKAIDDRQTALAKYLSEIRVRVPSSALSSALKTHQFEVFVNMVRVRYYDDDSLVLRDLPDSTSEGELLHLLELLKPRLNDGLRMYRYKLSLGVMLAPAVRKHHLRLLSTLVEMNAPIKTDSGLAIHLAIKTSDFKSLHILLRGASSTESDFTASLIPTAMSHTAPPNRRRAMHALLSVGVPPAKLYESLAALVAKGDVDEDLITQSREYEARLLGTSDDAILRATQAGDPSLLRMLCANADKSLLVKAVLAAFNSADPIDETTIGMFKALLEAEAGRTDLGPHLFSAIVGRSDIHMIRLLLYNGADANMADGQCYRFGMESGNYDILIALCQDCPPSNSTIRALLTGLTTKSVVLPQSLRLILASNVEADEILASTWHYDQLKRDPDRASSLIACLRCGLDVNSADGDIVCNVVGSGDLTLLETVLGFNPDLHTLAKAFTVSRRGELRPYRDVIWTMLLDSAKAAEIGQSEALVEETRFALIHDELKGLKILLKHNAAVDVNQGVALQEAAQSATTDILQLLLEQKPNLSSVVNAGLAVMASTRLDLTAKRRILDAILKNSGTTWTVNQLFTASVSKRPDCTVLVDVLLPCGEKVALDVLTFASATASEELFVRLIETVKSKSTVSKVFRHVRKSKMLPSRRYWVYECLLAKNVPQGQISKALIQSFRERKSHCLDIAQLLLRHNAHVGYKDCKAFQLAIQARSTDAIELLSQFACDDVTANRAYELLRDTTTKSNIVQWDISNNLLQPLDDVLFSDESLLTSLDESKCDPFIVKKLLVGGADPNQNGGHCFFLTARNELMPHFKKLCAKGTPEVVLQALLLASRDEETAVHWCGTYLREQSIDLGEHLRSSRFLDTCLTRFPKGRKILKLLIDHGMSVPFDSGSAEQDTKVELSSFLCRNVMNTRISNAVLLDLLNQIASQGNSTLSYISHASAGISAAMMCLMYTARTNILDRILQLDREGSLSCEVPADFVQGLVSSDSVSDASSGLTLRSAAMWLGNLDAFQILSEDAMPDDGCLHLAAFLALPRFVEWLLLCGHDANAQLDEYDLFVPLAIACTAEQRPCMIADQEADFRSRQREVIRLLAPRTDTKWRYRHKNVLHIGLENGAETTKMMLEALDTRADLDRYTKYVYEARDLKGYFPHAYVEQILEATQEEKKGLKDCLDAGGFDSRQLWSAAEDSVLAQDRPNAAGPSASRSASEETHFVGVKNSIELRVTRIKARVAELISSIDGEVG